MNAMEKALARLTEKERMRCALILAKLHSRSFRDLDVKKLKGREDVFRVRYGRIRILYRFSNEIIYILAVERRPDTAYNLGFSLLELIVYVGIFGVISALFVGVLFHANLGWTRSQVQSEVQQNLRFAMEDIARTAQNATAITSPAAGTSAASLSVVSGGQTVQYSLSGTVLQKQVGAGPIQALTTDKVKVTYLNFKTLQNTSSSNTAVQATSTQFAMTIEYNSTNNQFMHTEHATTTAMLKNK